VSYNPGYQNLLKGMKPSTRQRFVALRFDYPEASLETDILVGESGIERQMAARLVQLAGSLRALKDQDLEESASTRLLIHTARLINAGVDIPTACRAALVEPLSDDLSTVNALNEVVRAFFDE
jgi:nitric oxide reductase NorQ protein